MSLQEAKKLSNKITIDEAQIVLAYFDFKTNLGNFNIPEEFIEMIWDFTERTMETNFNLSEAYNFDTVSYAFMAFLEEHEINELIDGLYPTPSDKLTKTVDYNFVKKIVELYNDLETIYEI
jgi:hypothetical protein